MSFKQTLAPAFEPVTLHEAKDQCRVDGTEEDALISELIKTAREYCESYTRRLFVTQTWTYYDNCLDGSICLKPELQSVSSIKYLDDDGAQQTVAASEYELNTINEIGYVYLAYDKSWPSVRNVTNSVEIEFIAGYGYPADVPASIKSAMLLLIAHWFLNRESVIVGAISSTTPMAEDLLLNPYKVITF